MVFFYTNFFADGCKLIERLRGCQFGGCPRLCLKTPYRDGTTDVVFEPLDFMARLAALVPMPRVNLTRYHGVFAPNTRRREQVTPSRRGRRHAETADEPVPARHVSMSVKRHA